MWISLSQLYYSCLTFPSNHFVPQILYLHPILIYFSQSFIFLLSVIFSSFFLLFSISISLHFSSFQTSTLSSSLPLPPTISSLHFFIFILYIFLLFLSFHPSTIYYLFNPFSPSTTSSLQFVIFILCFPPFFILSYFYPFFFSCHSVYHFLNLKWMLMSSSEYVFLYLQSVLPSFSQPLILQLSIISSSVFLLPSSLSITSLI